MLSDEAPKPQQIDSATADVTSPTKNVTAGSEWNQAGTWEEKDTTAWVKERLTAWLEVAKFNVQDFALASYSVSAEGKVTRIKSLTGDAQLVTIRKELRHGYNFETELSFTISTTTAAPVDTTNLEGGKTEGVKESASGYLVIDTLMDAVQPLELKIDCKWKGSGPPAVWGSSATEQLLDLLKASVRSQMTAFREEYHQRR